MVPYLDKGGHGTGHFRAIAERGVVISSGDVYRAFARLWMSEPGPPDPVPLGEDSPLRTLRAPDGTPAEAFDNLEAESAALADPALPATVLRLPATHGPGDRQHRLARYLRSMRDDREAIVLGESHARWRWSRGYVENVAAAIALAVGDRRATGRIYNVGAEPVLTEAEWVRAIASLTGWKGELRVLPDEQLPTRLRQPFDFNQHLELDTTAIRSELGFRETVDETAGLRRTVEWELKTLDEVPNLRLDYGAEDEALTARFE
jgi:nucleoside-diphosphate-sugar epimerase